jgi:predicted  nucleic acid-binding Zn-ribbon protein
MTSTTDQHEEEDLRATYSGAKRRIAALEEQLEDLRNAGTKRKSYGDIHYTPS